MIDSRWGRLREGLKRTREGLVGRLERLVRGRSIDDSLLGEIEEILIQADVGVEATFRIMDRVREMAGERRIREVSEVIGLLKEELSMLLGPDVGQSEVSISTQPHVILVTGVNGTGKTTTIGKLAKRFSDKGLKVVMAACDTFRAAAIDQLAIWAQRAGADLIRSKPQADSASVAFDALEAAMARGVDVLLVDTAGRLHTKVNLMEELKKIRRVLARKMEGAPHQVLLTLDATTGQNAIAQAREFQRAVGVTGLVLAKLDGTAKGGVVVAIREELGIPVRYVGLGEKIDDLEPFDPQAFVQALFD